ncbi:MAG: hypothetical protein R3D00_29445 [Bacteroidia bacterium]
MRFVLGWYDYGFRWYGPEEARFVSVDPLAEDFAHMTTYQYASVDKDVKTETKEEVEMSATVRGVTTSAKSAFSENMDTGESSSNEEINVGIIVPEAGIEKIGATNEWEFKAGFRIMQIKK